jgi:hypothetical protein
VKRIFCLLMIACLAVSLSAGVIGCGGDESGPGESAPIDAGEEMTEEEEALEAEIGVEGAGGVGDLGEE